MQWCADQLRHLTDAISPALARRAATIPLSTSISRFFPIGLSHATSPFVFYSSRLVGRRDPSCHASAALTSFYPPFLINGRADIKSPGSKTCTLGLLHPTETVNPYAK